MNNLALKRNPVLVVFVKKQRCGFAGLDFFFFFFFFCEERQSLPVFVCLCI